MQIAVSSNFWLRVLRTFDSSVYLHKQQLFHLGIIKLPVFLSSNNEVKNIVTKYIRNKSYKQKIGCLKSKEFAFFFNRCQQLLSLLYNLVVYFL